MSKQCLDISQMKHLKDLGIDTSKAGAVRTDIWVTSDLDEFQKAEDVLVFTESESDYFEFENPIYTFTLQDILDLLPSTIDTETTDEINEYWLELGVSERDKSYWFVQYRSVDDKIYVNKDIGTLIDSAYEMLCWCIENRYVKTNKED